MFEINADELAVVCRGTWLWDAQDEGKTGSITFTGVSTDSRTVKKGDIFFALRGENFDGHDFIDNAIQGGAAAVVAAYDYLSASGITDNSAGRSNSENAAVNHAVKAGAWILAVENPLMALQQTAAWWRKKFSIPIIAVTGSSGKTTTKDILASLLSAATQVHSNVGNRNNEIGVPLTLLGLNKEHKACVLEMGMRGLGEIAQLCSVAQPTSGIITNVGSTHFERLGSLENIARAKGELAQCLPADGFIMLNAENEWSPYISSLSKAESLLFGFGEKAQVRASDIDFGSGYTEFTLTAFGVCCRLRVPLWGEHNIYNCLAAIGAYLRLGFPQEKLQQGLDQLTISGMRLERLKGIKGSTIINDAYNANPSSMLASLKVLRQIEGKRRIAVLGDMFELGDIAETEHRKVGDAVRNAGVDLLVTVGSLAAFISQQALSAGMETSTVFHGHTVAEAVDYLRECIQEGDVILVKGSRGMKMEGIVAALQSPADSHV